jgi:hypothetical protein
MYRTDRSPGYDATLGRVEFAAAKRRRGMARHALYLRSFGASGEQVPAVNPHARPSRSLSGCCHKSPRSLPAWIPGIPSSARDHSLSPATGTVPGITEISSFEFRRFGAVPRALKGLTPLVKNTCAFFSGVVPTWRRILSIAEWSEVPRLRGIPTVCAHGPINSGAGAPGSNLFWIGR